MTFRNSTRPSFKVREFISLRRRLYAHVKMLSNEIGPRNLQHYSALKKAQDYITEQMTIYNSEFSTQHYRTGKKAVNNLIIEKVGQSKPDEIIIVGAHYDTVMDSPGADDNATGIACVLELSRLLHNYANQRTLRFVAFTLEEPPFFGTEEMGSDVYAKSCKNNNENVAGMIALEMLGYYSERKRSQKYPFPDLKNHYSDRGNFIALVGNSRSEHLVNGLAKYAKKPELIRIRKLVSPAHFHGINLSDHASFWKYEYPAIMITDTAFYRNPYYHEVSDTIDKLNFRYFTRTVLSLLYALKKLDRQQILSL